MPATFTRINGVLVDTFAVRTATGLYPDPQFQGTGSFSANLATPLNPVASQGACFRGMPIGVGVNGFLQPISASGAAYVGVLMDDLTAFVVAKGTKVSYAHGGRVRSYAAAALTIGQPVKADKSATFSGFSAFVVGTDAPNLLAGYAFPIDDGSASNGATPASSMAQGDTIFVDLIG